MKWFLLWLLPITAYSQIYLTPEINFLTRKVQLHFTQDNRESIHIKECKLVHQSHQIYKFNLNHVFNQANGPTSKIFNFDLPQNFSIKNLSDKSYVECSPGKIKSSPWIINFSKSSSPLPSGWILKEGKLVIQKESNPLEKSIDLEVNEVNIAPNAIITISNGAILRLFSLSELSCNDCQFRLNDGSIWLNSSKSISFTRSQFTGGHNTVFNAFRSNSAITLEAPKVNLTNVKIQNSSADYSLKIQNSDFNLNYVVIESPRINGLSFLGSKGFLSNSFFKNVSETALLIFRTDVEISKTLIRDSLYGIMIKEKSRLHCINSEISDTKIGLNKKDSQVKIENCIFKNVELNGVKNAP